MKMTHFAGAALVAGSLFALPPLTQTASAADKQPAQSLSHEAPTKQPAQSLAHGAPTKQPAQSLAHEMPLKQSAQSLSHSDSGIAEGVTKQR